MTQRRVENIRVQFWTFSPVLVKGKQNTRTLIEKKYLKVKIIDIEKVKKFGKEKFLNRNSLTINLTFFAEFTYYHAFSERKREQKETKHFHTHSQCLKS